MVNSAFYHLLLVFVLLTEYFQNLRKIEGSFDFQSKQNQNQIADNFFDLTDCKWIFLKVRLYYLKFLKNYQNFSVNDHILSYLLANTSFKFGSICSLFMINDSLNHELFI